jgi:hypothetical protein
MQTLICDTRQKKGKHTAKMAYFNSLENYMTLEQKLEVGDYMIMGGHTSVDTKQHIQELAQDMWRDHKRFHNEIVKAQEMGIKLYILVETHHVINLDDLEKWCEPNDEYCKRGGKLKNRVSYRVKTKDGKYKNVCNSPKRIYGKALAQQCRTMEERYGCEFLFCAPSYAGRKVIQLLENEWIDKTK